MSIQPQTEPALVENPSSLLELGAGTEDPHMLLSECEDSLLLFPHEYPTTDRTCSRREPVKFA